MNGPRTPENQLRMETGHEMQNNIVVVPGDRIRFVTADNRTMFEVRAHKDGKSIDVRGVDTTKVNGTIYSCSLQVRPGVSNWINVSVVPYDE